MSDYVLMEDLLDIGQFGTDFRVRFTPKTDESDANLLLGQVTGTGSVNLICDLLDTSLLPLETNPAHRVLDVLSRSVAPGVLVLYRRP